MDCLYLMSDKRATYAIGAVAAGLALVLGLITAVPASDVSINYVPLGIMGHAEVVLKDTDGNIKAYQQSDNVVVINGQDCAADAIFGSKTALCSAGASPFTWIGIGSGTATAVDTNTKLQAAVLTRTGNLVLDSPATKGATGTGAMKTIVGTFTLAGPTTVAEVGLFDAGPGVGPDMFSRINLASPITAASLDTITITYKITVG